MGTELRLEFSPILVDMAKVELQCAWCYLFNLVGRIFKTLDELKNTMIIKLILIPDLEIFVKIGGDHGG